jgi:phosphoglycerol transferase MdoB-like AlkP superfamily enzyme|tara:strand:+ start:1991 stop:3919 length:1929 start_codon:yes stop_codon:yes gene_type:complete
MSKSHNIFLILKTYLLVLIIFSIFRGILFLSEISRVDFSVVETSTILQAFFMGVRFDIVITGYFMSVPAIVLLFCETIHYTNEKLRKGMFYWIFVMFTFTFIVAAADIPYFNQFYDRFSIGAFEWFDNLGFVFSMILQEPKYSLVAIPFIILDIVFFILLKKIFVEKTSGARMSVFANASLSLIVLALIFVGIRGRTSKKSPIRIGTAYFCDNAYLNKLGLNPVFTLMRSYFDSYDNSNDDVQLMDDELAAKKVREYLNITKPLYNSPIARIVTPDSVSTNKPNVVFIIMESMSAGKMGRHGNNKGMTPFLDSLSHKSVYFDNVYSAGKHTFNGIFSTLYSFPAIYRKHTMKKITEHQGISQTLLGLGYSTSYFTTHDSQFDNVEGFLRGNGFQNITSQKNYPAKEVKTTLGVPDDYLFRYSIPILNDLAKKKEPFFATFMTASDHGPYHIPPYFTPKNENIKDQIVEYADWSLRKFITLSKKEEWFDNTIFVFIADHGAPFNASYDIALNYFHTPLIIYSPSLLKDAKTYKNIGSQIDVFPTIMGVIKQPYINNTLGVDLINEKREYVLINDDDKIGVLDSTYFCVIKEDKLQLHKYRNRDTKDYFLEKEDKAKKMEEFGKANIQLYQRMQKRHETRLIEK